MKKGLINKAWIIVFLLTLAGCSLNFVYKNLDSIIPIYINNLVELDHLDDVFEQELVDFLSWHQREQFSDYQQWMTQTEQLIAKRKQHELSKVIVKQQIEKLSELFHVIRQRFYSDLSRLLPLLNQSQINELFTSLEENNHEYIQDSVQLEKETRIKKTQEALTDQFESWLGYLTKTQKDILNNHAARFKSLSKQRLQARLEWQQKTRRILEAKQTGQEKELEQLFIKLAQSHDKAYESVSSHNRELLSEVILKILATLETEQEQNLADKFQYYIKLISQLAQYKWK